jgi:tellurite resistance protein TerC
MFGLINITGWHWAGFVICILIFLALDLGVFHKHAHVVRFKEALCWTIVWASLSLCFGLVIAPGVVPGWTRQETLEFVTGYIVELSLSMDNVFVIALIFGYFGIPRLYQHRVLFWGIMGAIIMRGVMITTGTALVRRFDWLLYGFGLFLLLTGLRMLFAPPEGVHPERNIVLRLARKLFPVTNELHGQRFIVALSGRRTLTPLAVVLLMVETTDLIFAVDSIPAIFGVTTKPFIVFTSNIFAILGLRSLYFVLAGAIEYFRYLKVGLAVVLVFIGAKMLVKPHGHPPKWFQVDIPTGVSLLTVGAIVLTSIALSVTAAQREKKLLASKAPQQS